MLKIRLKRFFILMPMMMKIKISDIHKLILQNTKEINYLRNERSEQSDFLRENNIKLSQAQLKESYLAYAEKYDRLVFEYERYVGEDGLYESLRNHDKYTIEYALCFIEIRPYFYRSGYMYQRLMRKLNAVPMTEKQRERYLAVKESYANFKASRKKR